MNLATITQTISEQLRCRELSEIEGQRVKIHALSSIESDIQQAFKNILPPTCELVNTYDPALSIKKLGIMTLDFTVPQTVLASEYETGKELLKKLGYVDNPEVENAYRALAEVLRGSQDIDDPMCLAELFEDIARGQTFFKIELAPDKRPDIPSDESFKHFFDSPLPEGYLPRHFKVKRACFTNSQLVWLHTYGIGVSIL
jgi:hypothetical protein